ncbi:hypothetical protein BCF46_2013 [Litoreibacter meonggei]|uniref:Uncharacterized protein n=1 Tax=Litoreibacter meonggei TaxID=1049199 RepID=A0A497W5V0_9RHOB|nr:hypothetical protein [Litoreibacter meonggei]RLJ51791.1 hypothetical protein BCF46_2013 [Litoreibacter meonggei]
MSSYQTEVQNLNYNAATRCFEALVVFHEGHETRKVPISTPLPIATDFEAVSTVLVARAKAHRSKGRARLVSRSPIQKSGRLIHINDMIRQLKDTMGLKDMPAAA